MHRATAGLFRVRTLSEPLSLSSLTVPSGVPGTATHTRGRPPISSCRSLAFVLTWVTALGCC